jgi:hypothetical protein
MGAEFSRSNKSRLTAKKKPESEFKKQIPNDVDLKVNNYFQDTPRRKQHHSISEKQESTQTPFRRTISLGSATHNQLLLGKLNAIIEPPDLPGLPKASSPEEQDPAINGIGAEQLKDLVTQLSVMLCEKEHQIQRLQRLLNATDYETTQEIERLRTQVAALESVKICPICMDRAKDIVFICGHCFCKECTQNLAQCPLCRKYRRISLKLYL